MEYGLSHLPSIYKEKRKSGFSPKYTKMKTNKFELGKLQS